MFPRAVVAAGEDYCSRAVSFRTVSFGSVRSVWFSLIDSSQSVRFAFVRLVVSIEFHVIKPGRRFLKIRKKEIKPCGATSHR